MKTGGIIIGAIGMALLAWHLIRVSSEPDYTGYASHQVMAVNAVVVIVFGIALYFMGAWRKKRREENSSQRNLKEEKMATHKDPVCGMQVEEPDAAGQTEHQGTTYYFCSTSCKDKFEASPEDYTSQ